MATGALNLLVEILAAHYLKTVAIDKLVGVEEGALSAALFRVKRRGGKIDDLLHCLSLAQKSLAEFHHVNPIVVTPLRFVALGATKTIVEVLALQANKFERNPSM